MARIYLARHGRTALNASGALRGRLDPPLDAVGRRQAAALAALLREAAGPVAIVVSSPLRRATETAAAIAAATRCPLEVDDRLADRDYGRWAGKPHDAVVGRWGSLDAAPGVESKDAVRARAWSGLATLAERAERAGNGIAVAVAHDAVNRLLLAAADPSLSRAGPLAQAPGCYNELEVRDGTWTVLAVGVVPGGGDPDGGDPDGGDPDGGDPDGGDPDGGDPDGGDPDGGDPDGGDPGEPETT